MLFGVCFLCPDGMEVIIKSNEGERLRGYAHLLDGELDPPIIALVALSSRLTFTTSFLIIINQSLFIVGLLLQYIKSNHGSTTATLTFNHPLSTTDDCPPVTHHIALSSQNTNSINTRTRNLNTYHILRRRIGSSERNMGRYTARSA